MASVVRTGRVSSVDYRRGTCQVTYYDRGQSVTRTVNIVSNGEYRMPKVGQIITVCHNSNGTAAATTAGDIWNRQNLPPEGFKGLWRKDFASVYGQAFERYDENTGVFQLCVDGRAERISNGEIYDEAKGAASFVAKEQLQLKSADKSVSIQAKLGVGINAGETVSLEAGKDIVLQGGGTLGLFAAELLAIIGKAEIAFNKEEVKLSFGGAEIIVDKEGGIAIISPKKIMLKAPDIQEIRG